MLSLFRKEFNSLSYDSKTIYKAHFGVKTVRFDHISDVKGVIL